LTRRDVIGAIAAASLGPAVLGGMADAREAQAMSTAYLGSFTSWGKQRGRGLEIGAVDPASGRLTVTGHVGGVPDASFLAFSADRQTLYATNELIPHGTVTALSIGGAQQSPSVLNKQPTKGAGPTHLSVHPGGRHLLTANYTDGTIAVHPLSRDGRIGEPTDLARHSGETRDAHAHQVLTDPSGQWVVAVDLGADAVYVYGLDLAKGKLTPHQQLKLPVGAGPRHLAFHPGGQYAYILGELRSEITVAAWDAAAGRFTLGQVIGTLGDAAPKRNAPAEIQVSPDGRFVYASNRGHDSIAMFSTQERGSRLSFGGATPTGGAWPRHFTLDPAGRWLYVANQNSNAVNWLPRDPDTGTLGPSAGSAPVNNVGIILFR
jgi:6-phosphogluconolactonase (cycloisomerase 2 family)